MIVIAAPKYMCNRNAPISIGHTLLATDAVLMVVSCQLICFLERVRRIRFGSKSRGHKLRLGRALGGICLFATLLFILLYFAFVFCKAFKGDSARKPTECARKRWFMDRFKECKQMVSIALFADEIFVYQLMVWRFIEKSARWRDWISGSFRRNSRNTDYRLNIPLAHRTLSRLVIVFNYSHTPRRVGYSFCPNTRALCRQIPRRNEHSPNINARSAPSFVPN